jgi:asparagine synthetase B (glutamine-hydrolysing)
MLGVDPGTQPLPSVEPSLTPLAAMEEAIVRALERPPCVVSFSGGRDSSAVLAVAVQVARREALPPPIPVTLRFPDAPGSQESAWQERVVGHLQLDDWRRLELSDELDFVGPVAGALIRRHGVLFPANTHFHGPIAAQARGGTVLTGAGGDQIMWGPRRRQTLTRRALPPAIDLLRGAYGLLPPSLRRPIVQRRPKYRQGWLRPEAVRMIADRIVANRPDPARRDARVRWSHRTRYTAATRYSLGVLAADHDAVAIHPFMEPRFLVSVARLLGPGGLGDRATLMRMLFGHLLPPELIERPRKAHFAEAFQTETLREFLRGWEGGGVDSSLVDEAALRRLWRDSLGEPPARSMLGRTALLAQSVWLACDDAGHPTPRRT